MNQRYTVEQNVVLKNLAIAINAEEELEPNGMPSAANFIEEKKGSRKGCLRILRSLHERKAENAWFAQQDLIALKHHAYTATKLFYIHSKEFEPRNMTRESEYFYALTSDHTPLIDWLMHLEPHTPPGLHWINDPSEHFYRHFQMTLALRGRWQELAERAERFLQEVPAKMKKFTLDHRFYLALAQGNLADIQETLTELTSPKTAKVRSKIEDFDFPFCSTFIGCYATMYAKIAWRHGFEVSIDTPLIPKEWLPVAPLSNYEDPYNFMREYDTHADLPPPITSG